MANKTPKGNFSFSERFIALFLSVSLALSNGAGYAAPSSSVGAGLVPALRSGRPQGAPLQLNIPSSLGTVEEFFSGPSSKTIIYIQDAHDSLEAQENIAKIIHYLVDKYGVKTVYEEGYEGPVPTDKYFGKIEDPKIREKVAYFLMDKLRLGGAEYAHITRTHDFDLIGADNLKLHKKNIERYQESAKYRQDTERDLEAMGTAIRKLAQKYFTRDLKEWMGIKERFDRQEIDLLDYLRRTQMLFLKGIGFEEFGAKYPNISLLLSADKTKDEKLLGKRKAALNYKTLFAEIDRLEDDYAKVQLKEMRDREIFRYYKLIQLLKRLNAIEVTEDEYEAVKESLKQIDTAKIAKFLAAESHKSVVLSKIWETHIQSAIEFYEVARERDGMIKKEFDQYVIASEAKQSAFKNQIASPSARNDDAPVILVYGGFHKGSIKELLNASGLSYSIVTPKITSISLKHQQYYKQLMQMGYHSMDLPSLVAKATSPPHLLAFPVENSGTEENPEDLIRDVESITPATNASSGAEILQEMDLKYRELAHSKSVSNTNRSATRQHISRTASAKPQNAAAARSEARITKFEAEARLQEAIKKDYWAKIDDIDGNITRKGSAEADPRAIDKIRESLTQGIPRALASGRAEMISPEMRSLGSSDIEEVAAQIRHGLSPEELSRFILFPEHATYATWIENGKRLEIDLAKKYGLVPSDFIFTPEESEHFYSEIKKYLDKEFPGAIKLKENMRYSFSMWLNIPQKGGMSDLANQMTEKLQRFLADYPNPKYHLFEPVATAESVDLIIKGINKSLALKFMAEKFSIPEKSIVGTDDKASKNGNGWGLASHEAGFSTREYDAESPTQIPLSLALGKEGIDAWLDLEKMLNFVRFGETAIDRFIGDVRSFNSHPRILILDIDGNLVSDSKTPLGSEFVELILGLRNEGVFLVFGSAGTENRLAGEDGKSGQIIGPLTQKGLADGIRLYSGSGARLRVYQPNWDSQLLHDFNWDTAQIADQSVTLLSELEINELRKITNAIPEAQEVMERPGKFAIRFKDMAQAIQAEPALREAIQKTRFSLKIQQRLSRIPKIPVEDIGVNPTISRDGGWIDLMLVAKPFIIKHAAQTIEKETGGTVDGRHIMILDDSLAGSPGAPMAAAEMGRQLIRGELPNVINTGGQNKNEVTDEHVVTLTKQINQGPVVAKLFLQRLLNRIQERKQTRSEARISEEENIKTGLAQLQALRPKAQAYLALGSLDEPMIKEIQEWLEEIKKVVFRLRYPEQQIEGRLSPASGWFPGEIIFEVLVQALAAIEGGFTLNKLGNSAQGLKSIKGGIKRLYEEADKAQLILEAGELDNIKKYHGVGSRFNISGLLSAHAEEKEKALPDDKENKIKEIKSLIQKGDFGLAADRLIELYWKGMDSKVLRDGSFRSNLMDALQDIPLMEVPLSEIYPEYFDRNFLRDYEQAMRENYSYYVYLKNQSLGKKKPNVKINRAKQRLNQDLQVYIKNYLQTAQAIELGRRGMIHPHDIIRYRRHYNLVYGKFADEPFTIDEIVPNRITVGEKPEEKIRPGEMALIRAFKVYEYRENEWRPFIVSKYLHPGESKPRKVVFYRSLADQRWRRIEIVRPQNQGLWIAKTVALTALDLNDVLQKRLDQLQSEDVLQNRTKSIPIQKLGNEEMLQPLMLYGKSRVSKRIALDEDEEFSGKLRDATKRNYQFLEEELKTEGLIPSFFSKTSLEDMDKKSLERYASTAWNKWYESYRKSSNRLSVTEAQEADEWFAQNLSKFRLSRSEARTEGSSKRGRPPSITKEEIEKMIERAGEKGITLDNLAKQFNVSPKMMSNRLRQTGLLDRVQRRGWKRTSSAQLKTHQLLSELILKPSDFKWQDAANALPDLRGLPLGQTQENGAISFSPVKSYYFVWPVLGFSEAGWEAVIEQGKVKGNVYELVVKLSKGDRTLRRIFQIGSYTKVLKGRGGQKGKTVTVLDINDRLGLRALGEILAQPDQLGWRIETGNLPDLKNLRLGKTASRGRFLFKILENYRFSWNDTGVPGKGWKGVITRSRIHGKAFEFTVRFTKKKRIIDKTYQFSPLFTGKIPYRGKDLAKAEKGAFMPVLEMGQKLGLKALSELVRKPSDFDWEAEREYLPDLAGLSVGETNGNGQVTFAPEENYPFRWRILGFHEKGWKGFIVKSGVRNGYYEITARLTKKGKRPVLRTFQMGHFTEKVEGRLKEKGRTKSFLEINARPGLRALTELMTRASDTVLKGEEAHLPRLEGLQLGKTGEKGRIHWAPFPHYRFTWPILGFPEKGWKAVIARSWIENGRVRFVVELTKRGRSPIYRKFQIGPFRRTLKNYSQEDAPTKLAFHLINLDTTMGFIQQWGGRSVNYAHGFEGEKLEPFDAEAGPFAGAVGGEMFEQLDRLISLMDEQEKEIAYRMIDGESDENIAAEFRLPGEKVQEVKHLLQLGLQKFLEDQKRSEARASQPELTRFVNAILNKVQFKGLEKLLTQKAAVLYGKSVVTAVDVINILATENKSVKTLVKQNAAKLAGIINGIPRKTAFEVAMESHPTPRLGFDSPDLMPKDLETPWFVDEKQQSFPDLQSLTEKIAQQGAEFRAIAQELLALAKQLGAQNQRYLVIVNASQEEAKKLQAAVRIFTDKAYLHRGADHMTDAILLDWSRRIKSFSAVIPSMEKRQREARLHREKILDLDPSVLKVDLEALARVKEDLERRVREFEELIPKRQQIQDEFKQMSSGMQQVALEIKQAVEGGEAGRSEARQTTESIDELYQIMKENDPARYAAFFEKIYTGLPADVQEIMDYNLMDKDLGYDKKHPLAAWTVLNLSILERGDATLQDLKKLKKIARLYHQLAGANGYISETLAIVMSIGGFYGGLAETSAFPRLTKNLQQLPGAYKYWAIAADLLFVGFHSRRGLLPSEELDLKPHIPNVQFVLETLERGRLDAAVLEREEQLIWRALKISLVHYIVSIFGFYTDSGTGPKLHAIARLLAHREQKTLDFSDWQSIGEMAHVLFAHKEMILKTVDEIRTLEKKQGFTYANAVWLWFRYIYSWLPQWEDAQGRPIVIEKALLNPFAKAIRPFVTDAFVQILSVDRYLKKGKPEIMELHRKRVEAQFQDFKTADQIYDLLIETMTKLNPRSEVRILEPEVGKAIEEEIRSVFVQPLPDTAEMAEMVPGTDPGTGTMRRSEARNKETIQNIAKKYRESVTGFFDEAQAVHSKNPKSWSVTHKELSAKESGIKLVGAYEQLIKDLSEEAGDDALWIYGFFGIDFILPLSLAKGKIRILNQGGDQNVVTAGAQILEDFKGVENYKAQSLVEEKRRESFIYADALDIEQYQKIRANHPGKIIFVMKGWDRWQGGRPKADKELSVPEVFKSLLRDFFQKGDQVVILSKKDLRFLAPAQAAGFSLVAKEEVPANAEINAEVMGFTQPVRFWIPDAVAVLEKLDSEGVDHQAPRSEVREVPKPEKNYTPDPMKLQRWVDREKDPRFKSIKQKLVDYFLTKGHVSYRDFRKALNNQVENLNQKLKMNGKDYAVLFGAPHSSSRWTYYLVKDKLIKPPSEEIYLHEDYDIDGQLVFEKILKKGVRQFVIFDDSAYRGGNIQITIKEVLRTFDSLHIQQRPNFILVVPYMTSFARETFGRMGKENSNSVQWIKPVNSISSIVEILSPAEWQLIQSERNGRLDTSGRLARKPIEGSREITLTYFDHKIADEFSFLPYLVSYLPKIMPPYKRRGTPYYRQESEEIKRIKKAADESEEKIIRTRSEARAGGREEKYRKEMVPGTDPKAEMVPGTDPGTGTMRRSEARSQVLGGQNPKIMDLLAKEPARLNDIPIAALKIEEDVDAPWREAVETFIAKNIPTRTTSANRKDLEDKLRIQFRGGQYAMIGFKKDGFNRRNFEIFQNLSQTPGNWKYGKVKTAVLEDGLPFLYIPITPETTVAEFSSFANEIAQKFESQPRSEARASREWKDFSYHLERLKSAEPEKKLAALQTLYRQLILMPFFDQTPKIIDALLAQFPEISDPGRWEKPSFDPALRSWLVAVLTLTAWDREVVRDRFLQILQNHHSEDGHVLFSWINESKYLIQRFSTSSDPAERKILEPRISQIRPWMAKQADSLLPLLSSTDPWIVVSTLDLLLELLGYPNEWDLQKRGAIYVTKNQLKKRVWLDSLQPLMKSHPHPSVRLSAAQILRVLNQKIDPKFEDLFTRLEESRGTSRHTEIAMETIKEMRGQHYETKLAPGEMAELYRQIREEGDLPANVLGELLDEGKKMIFINPAEGMIPQGISEGLAEDIVSLAERPENALTHFALPIPPSQKQNLEQALDRTKQHGPLGRFMVNPEFLKILDMRMPYFMDRGKFFELLEKLRSRKVEFVLYGAESGLTGENMFDSQRANLLKFFRENPAARTLVFGTFTTGQMFSRTDLTSGRNQTHPSLVKALSEAGLKQADITSVSAFETNEMDWLTNSDLYKLYNLGDFLNRYQINSSFALKLKQGEVPLSILLFAPEFRELYGQAWDAVIFYTKDHRKDRDFFIRPEASRPKGLEAPSKSLLATRSEVRAEFFPITLNRRNIKTKSKGQVPVILGEIENYKLVRRYRPDRTFSIAAEQTPPAEKNSILIDNFRHPDRPDDSSDIGQFKASWSKKTKTLDEVDLQMDEEWQEQGLMSSLWGNEIRRFVAERPGMKVTGQIGSLETLAALTDRLIQKNLPLPEGILTAIKDTVKAYQQFKGQLPHDIHLHSTKLFTEFLTHTLLMPGTPAFSEEEIAQTLLGKLWGKAGLKNLKIQVLPVAPSPDHQQKPAVGILLSGENSSPAPLQLTPAKVEEILMPLLPSKVTSQRAFTKNRQQIFKDLAAQSEITVNNVRKVFNMAGVKGVPVEQLVTALQKASSRSEVRAGRTTQQKERLKIKRIEKLSIPAGVFLDAAELAQLSAKQVDQHLDEILALVEKHSGFDVYIDRTDRYPVYNLPIPKLQKLLNEYPNRVHLGMHDRANLNKKKVLLQVSFFQGRGTAADTHKAIGKLKEKYQIREEIFPLEYTGPGALKSFLDLAESLKPTELLRKVSEIFATIGANGRWRMAESFVSAVWARMRAAYVVAWSA